jgi:hypothetical protein
VAPGTDRPAGNERLTGSVNNQAVFCGHSNHCYFPAGVAAGTLIAQLAGPAQRTQWTTNESFSIRFYGSRYSVVHTSGFSGIGYSEPPAECIASDTVNHQRNELPRVQCESCGSGGSEPSAGILASGSVYHQPVVPGRVVPDIPVPHDVAYPAQLGFGNTAGVTLWYPRISLAMGI